MTDAQSTETDREAGEPQRPRFRGCVFCYVGEWALHAGRKAYDASRRSAGTNE